MSREEHDPFDSLYKKYSDLDALKSERISKLTQDIELLNDFSLKLANYRVASKYVIDSRHKDLRGSPLNLKIIKEVLDIDRNEIGELKYFIRNFHTVFKRRLFASKLTEGELEFIWLFVTEKLKTYTSSLFDMNRSAAKRYCEAYLRINGLIKIIGRQYMALLELRGLIIRSKATSPELRINVNAALQRLDNERTGFQRLQLGIYTADSSRRAFLKKAVGLSAFVAVNPLIDMAARYLGGGIAANPDVSRVVSYLKASYGNLVRGPFVYAADGRLAIVLTDNHRTPKIQKQAIIGIYENLGISYVGWENWARYDHVNTEVSLDELPGEIAEHSFPIDDFVYGNAAAFVLYYIGTVMDIAAEMNNLRMSCMAVVDGREPDPELISAKCNDFLKKILKILKGGLELDEGRKLFGYSEELAADVGKLAKSGMLYGRPLDEAFEAALAKYVKWLEEWFSMLKGKLLSYCKDLRNTLGAGGRAGSLGIPAPY